ncbi:MAG: von Willebrand factor type A domain-containing protein [Verrucomicrobiales bacterium]|nr:von Willebrand factor type A domain-containing protein [Verrucomicrobiales bacterium]
MNDETLHPWIEPELEARIVALVLGEASDFEREELERLIGEKPELALFRNRMDSLHGMLRGLGRGEEWDSEEEWKLPAEKRKTVLDVIDGAGTVKGNEGRVEPKKATVPFRRRVRPLLQWAALFAILACIAGMMFPALQGPMQPKSLQYDEAAVEFSSKMPTVATASHVDSMSVAIDEEILELDSLERRGRIDIEGNEKTRDQVLRRELRLTDKPTEVALMEATAPPAPGEALDAYAQIGHGGYSSERESIRTPAITSEEGASDGDISVVAGGDITLSDSQKNTELRRMASSGSAPSSEFLSRVEEQWESKEEAGKPSRSTRYDAIGNGGRGGTDREAGQKLAKTDRMVSSSGAISDLEDKAPLLGDLPAIGQWFVDQSGSALEFPSSGRTAETDEGNANSLFARQKGSGYASEHTQLGFPVESDFRYTNPSLGDNRQLLEKQHGGVVGISVGKRPGIAPGQKADASSMDDLYAIVPKVVGGGVEDGRKNTPGEGSPGAKGVLTDGAILFPSIDDIGVQPEVLRLGTDEPAFSDHLFGRNYLGGANKLRGFDYRMVGADGAEAVSDPDFQVDLKLQPEVVDFDGFVNYGSEISPGRETEVQLAQSKQKMAPSHPATPPLSSALFPGITDGLHEADADAMKRLSQLVEELQASEEPFSTFSLHVSDVSFQLAKSSLAQDEWPDATRIRIEEFVNAFDYDDPMPTAEEKVAAKIEQAAHPFLQQRNVLRVAMRTAAAGRDASTPLRLTFLLDNSGSMERADRRETVRRAFALLVGQLQPNDQVTLISFARQPRLLADQVSGDKANDLVSIISSLPSEGGTNLESALQLAFEKAKEQELASAQNRIVLLTDGAANLGDAKPESLSRKIEEMREAGIAFDAAGIGTEDLNDEILEALTRKGDGRYYLLDSPESADAGFARKIAGAFRPAAKNVKIQVEFNPDRVGFYKLLGFEKHRLSKEDFRNDKVDAAEMAAEEAGVAVYQFEAKPEGSGDIGAVSVRFLDMASGEIVERRWPIPFEAEAPAVESAAPSLQLASCAALFAAKLKGAPLGDTVDLPELSRLVSELPGNWQKRERVAALREMIETARELEGR